MELNEGDIQAARDYLRKNAALRSAVGVDDGGDLEPHYLGVGEHNLNYRFQTPNGGAFVLRVNVAPQPFHENQVAYEFAALRALAPSGCTPRPIYLDDSPSALGKGVIVESFCEGQELDFDNLHPGDLGCAIRLMADVHAVRPSGDCPLFRPNDPLRILFDECLQRFNLYRSSAFEDARITKWVERFISLIGPRMEESACRPEDRTHIVNTEPLPSHFLIPRENEGGTGAFIDWERPIIGEPAQDLAYFTAPTTTFWDSEWLMPSDVAEAVVEDYWREVDGRFERGRFDERYHLYRAMTVLRSTTWCCRALITYRQSDTHQTEKTAGKLPAYLSDDFLQHVAEECF